MNKQTVAEMIAAFVPNQENTFHQETMPEGELKDAVVKMSEAFTGGVGFLKHFFPNPAIRELMTMVWDLVGNRITPVACGPSVPTLTLAVMGNRQLLQAIIFMPHNWLQMIGHKPPNSVIYQMGGLVFVGSQAVDFYNGKFLDSPHDVEKRARAHEAEYLITVDDPIGTVGFNDYQKKLLDEYPKGLATPSIRSLLYKSKPFVKPA